MYQAGVRLDLDTVYLVEVSDGWVVDAAGLPPSAYLAFWLGYDKKNIMLQAGIIY